jgi:signal transduction histidine kinase
MKSRMRLVAAAGHDIRTPITRMRLRAEFLDDTDKDKWLADLDELDRIADSAIRLVREETADDTGEEVRLENLLEDVVLDLQAQQFDIQLMVLEPAIVRAGPLALKRAFRNLMINAATHGGGGHINMSVCGNLAIVQICDDGPGIPENMLERALEPFFRVEPARSTRSGAGLGLAIAREIIERNGGSLRLSNGTSKGLLQTVELPLVAKSPRQQHPRAA